MRIELFQHRTRPKGPKGQERYSSTLSLTSSTDGVGSQRYASVALPPGKTRYPLYRVSPRAGLDGCGKSLPHRDSIPVPSSPWQVAIPNELSRPILNEWQQKLKKKHIKEHIISAMFEISNRWRSYCGLLKWVWHRVPNYHNIIFSFYHSTLCFCCIRPTYLTQPFPISPIVVTDYTGLSNISQTKELQNMEFHFTLPL